MKTEVAEWWQNFGAKQTENYCRTLGEKIGKRLPKPHLHCRKCMKATAGLQRSSYGSHSHLLFFIQVQGTWKLATSSAATSITHSTRKLCKASSLSYHLPHEHAPANRDRRRSAERYHRHVAGGNHVRAGLPALPLPRPVAVGQEPHRAAARAPRPHRLPLPPLPAGVLPADLYSTTAAALGVVRSGGGPQRQWWS